MATLVPQQFCSVADGGYVELDVDPTPFGDAELYERVVPFGTTATRTSPPFHRVPLVFTDGGPARYRTNAPPGSLYQARLFPRGVVPAGGMPTDRDRPIGTVDLPCVYVEARVRGLLTRCVGDRAQLALDVGDTWLGAVLVTGALRTRMLLLVGADEPAETFVSTGLWPRFGERTPLASAASPGPARVHRLYAPPRARQPAGDGVDPRTTVYYAAIVWTEDGRWDHVWSDDGIGGTGRPQAVTTGTRDIAVRVESLTCLDDAFENDFGVGWQLPDGASYPDDSDPIDDDSLFQIVLTTGGPVALAWKSYLWEDVDDGDVVTPPNLEFDWSGGAEAHGATIYVGSGRCEAVVEVPLPAGEGVRSSTYRVRATGLRDGEVGFYADLVVTVGYH